MKINILKDTLLIFLGSTVAFLFVPLFMVGNSPEEYSFLDWEIFYKTSIFFIIIVGTFFSLVNTILQVLKLDNISTLLIYFVLSWITISGFIFSVSSSSGMIDPRVNPLDLVHIVIVLLVSVLFSIISITAFKKYIQIFLSIVVLTSTLPSLISIYSSNSIKVATDNHPSLQLSNNKNIFVISFDGIPGKTVSDIIKNNKNLGFADACNIGSEAVMGEYLLFLNPDALLGDNSVEKLVNSFNFSPDVGMVGGLLINPNGTEQAGGRRAIPTPWRSFVRAFGLSRFENRWPILFYDFCLHKKPLPDKPIYVEAISGACMMIKKEVMEEVGHWDKDYFLHCEDLDLCMRFRQKGYKILFVPDAPIIHYLGLCSTSHPVFAEWHKHKGMIRFYKKFFSMQYPGALMWLVKLGVWMRFSGIFVYLTLRRWG